MPYGQTNRATIEHLGVTWTHRCASVIETIKKNAYITTYIFLVALNEFRANGRLFLPVYWYSPTSLLTILPFLSNEPILDFRAVAIRLDKGFKYI